MEVDPKSMKRTVVEVQPDAHHQRHQVNQWKRLFTRLTFLNQWMNIQRIMINLGFPIVMFMNRAVQALTRFGCRCGRSAVDSGITESNHSGRAEPHSGSTSSGDQAQEGQEGEERKEERSKPRDTTPSTRTVWEASRWATALRDARRQKHPRRLLNRFSRNQT